jgi:hypothetical protein
MGQLKFEWIFENGEFVGRRVVLVDSTEELPAQTSPEQEVSLPKAS